MFGLMFEWCFKSDRSKCLVSCSNGVSKATGQRGKEEGMRKLSCDGNPFARTKEVVGDVHNIYG